MTGFHAKAWLAWAGATVLVALSVASPPTSILMLAALAVVATTFARRGPEGRSFGALLKVAFVILAIRVVLFGVAGHAGATALVTLPEVRLPWWLGGLTLGGRITAEVVGQSVAEGLEIAVILACAGVLLAAVETGRLLRVLPRALFEAGLVVGIGLAFIPTLVRTVADVRDAQRLRGHRFRGARSLRPLVVPVLATALERSLEIAASMESRGFGRDGRAAPAPRVALLGGVLTATVGGGVALAGSGVAGGALAASGLAIFAGAMRALGRAAPRTSYRAGRTDVWDRALVAFSAALALAAVAARALDAAAWYAYPAFTWPAIDVRLVALGVAVVAPVPLAAARAALLRRASVRAELRSDPAPLPARAERAPAEVRP